MCRQNNRTFNFEGVFTHVHTIVRIFVSFMCGNEVFITIDQVTCLQNIHIHERCGLIYYQYAVKMAPVLQTRVGQAKTFAQP